MEFKSPPQLPLSYDGIIHIPVYTFDGINWKSIDCTSDIHIAKFRLKSVLPEPYKLNDPDYSLMFPKVRCAILTYQLGIPISVAEFPIKDFTEVK